MVKMTAIYEGQKHCTLVHEPSGSQLETDAPRDNQGLGERFSPTDLVGAALASCVLTTMAIVGEQAGIDVAGARAEAEKDMSPKPRRIRTLRLKVTLPAALTASQRAVLEGAAGHCPVHASLHPDVDVQMSFAYL